MHLLIVRRVVIPNQIRFYFQAGFPVFFKMNTDAVRLIAFEELIDGTAKLLFEVVRFTDKNMLVRDLVRIVRRTAGDEIDPAFLPEYRRQWMDDKTVPSSRFSNE